MLGDFADFGFQIFKIFIVFITVLTIGNIIMVLYCVLSIGNTFIVFITFFVFNYNPYGSNHCLRRYLIPSIIPRTLPKKVLGSIGNISLLII